MHKLIFLIFILSFLWSGQARCDVYSPQQVHAELYRPLAFEKSDSTSFLPDLFSPAFNRPSNAFKGQHEVIRSETELCARITPLWTAFKKILIDREEPSHNAKSLPLDFSPNTIACRFTDPAFNPLAPRAPPCL